MEKLKTYESFWDFRKKPKMTQKDINNEKLKKIPHFLKESGIAKDILDLKVTTYEIGFSRLVPNKLVLDVNGSNFGQFVRFEFLVDDDYFVIKPIRCLYSVNNVVSINSDKPKDFEDFGTELSQMFDLERGILQFMRENDLVK